MAIDLSRFEQHLKKSGTVRYVYRDYGASLSKDELRIGTPAQASYAESDFETAICHSAYNSRNGIDVGKYFKIIATRIVWSIHDFIHYARSMGNCIVIAYAHFHLFGYQ